MNGDKVISDLDRAIQEELKDSEFAEAWAESELEDQIKRMLIEARLERKMTQKQLAEKSGLRQSNISRIENGTAVPTLQTLNAIARSIGKKLRISFDD